MPWICASSRPGARVTGSSCSASAAPTSSASGRDLEAAGGARATVTRRLCPIAGFCKYAVEEELLDHSPAVHVRRPRLDYESPATSLDRNEVGALLVAAGHGTAAEHALISLPALNGLRVSEATGADIEAPGTGRGHRTLAITPKAGKKAVIPLAPRTARAIDLTVGERCEGPIFTTPAGQRLDRHGAGRIVRRVARRAGLAKKIGPNPLRHAFITAALDTGVPLRDVQEAASHADPRTTIRYDRARVSLDRHATYIVAAYIAGAARQTHPEDAPPGSVLAARRPGDCSSPVARSRSATTGSDTSHDEGSLGAARSSRRGPA